MTSAARTVVDLGSSVSFRAGVVVADSALYRGKTTKAELDRVLSSCSCWPGIEQARRVIGFSARQAERAGSAESAGAGVCAVPRSRRANISLMMAIQIRAVLATCTQTRPAGRPEKYCA